MNTPLSRRDALTWLGAAGLTVALGACSDDDDPETAASSSSSTAADGSSSTTATAGGSSSTAATPTTAITCVLTPEQTEGPFYVDGAAVRRDITDGHDGAPLELRLLVADADACTPIADAAVDIWHADAAGAYSEAGDLFLRGVQRTDANGVATFDTIFPGWYRGRTVHIHVKVHIGGNTVHTGQLYFPDEETDAVFALAPYTARGARDTRNGDDSIYRDGGAASTVALSGSGNALKGAITLGIRG